MTTRTSTHWGDYLVDVRDGQIERITPHADDPDPSPIGPGMVSAHRSHTRIQAPMVRAGWLEHGPGSGAQDAWRRGAEPFVEVTHAEAVELIARELDRVRTQHGNEAIFAGSYGWASAGRFHHAKSQLHRFMNLIGGFTTVRDTYSSAAVSVILDRVAGGKREAMDGTPTWDDIAEHGELVVAFGGLPQKNLQVTGGGVSSHEAARWQERCREAGVRFVNVSPQRGDVATGVSSDWVACRPNTDVALMLGMAHTLATEGLHDIEFLERCCEGWDRFEAYLLGETDGTPKDAAWASSITGVDADVISRLARDVAASRSVITAAYALQRAHHGEQVHWMAMTLAAMSGSMGRPGGGLGAGLSAMHHLGMPRSPIDTAGVPMGTNPTGSFIPVARISDMLLQPGTRYDYDGQSRTYPDIRLVYWAGGNPFHHHQDLNRLMQAWHRPETVIVHEPWWTPLAKRADIVMPVATMLERDDIARGHGDHRLSPMYAAVSPPAGVRTDHEILRDVAQHLGVADAFTEGRTTDEWIAHLYEQTRTAADQHGVMLPPFDAFWEGGEPVDIDRLPRRATVYEGLRDDPDTNPVRTPSGRLEIHSTTIESFVYDDCPGHPTWMEPAEWLGSAHTDRFPLHLCSNQPSTRLHSQYDHGDASRDNKVQEREPVLISADDAQARGIRDGDVVRLFNERGACLAGAVVTDEIMPGVVSLSTGAWFDPQDPSAPDSLEVHGNPNAVTLDIGTSSLAQGPSSNTTLVEVERFKGSLPPVRAFDPPQIVVRDLG
ncbi:MAG: molybdopterin-dependent oxidoreductase [Nitriliruptoraceae bacterium]